MAAGDGAGLVEPIPGTRAAVVEGAERLLLIADYHAGYEAALRHERGVHVPSRAAERRDRLRRLLDWTGADRLVVLGDLTHSIGAARGAERGEVETLIGAIDVPVTVAKGNHDGEIEAWAAGVEGDVCVTTAGGTAIDDLGIVHGHAWPNERALDARVLAVGHEHPRAALEDAVGGRQAEPVWLRGPVHPTAFRDRVGDDAPVPEELVVVPAFNAHVGGTRVDEDAFLAPFLPAGFDRVEGYLLDGTRLGRLYPTADPNQSARS